VAELGHDVLAIVESNDGDLRQSSFEAFTAGRKLADDAGGSLVALAIGAGISEDAESLAQLGPDRVLVADHRALARITIDGYLKAIDAALERVNPAVIVLTGTTGGRDVASFLAGRDGLAHLPDCLEVWRDGDEIVGKRPVYGGKMLTQVRASSSRRVVVTLHTNAYPMPEADSGQPAEVESLDVDIADGDIRMRITGLESSSGGPTDLGTADVVVIGGRGLGSKENFDLVQQLADALGGTVGATRAITDLGWRPHYEQVGQTGHKITPKLYIGLGVSGAVQHTVGMRGAETIIAINRDPDAPIHKIADLGVVGDLTEIVPKLVERIRAKRGG
jgi:electron transfer flavoprotein alpha subunit